MTIYSVQYTFSDNSTVIERYINNFDNEKNAMLYNEIIKGKMIIDREIIETLKL